MIQIRQVKNGYELRELSDHGDYRETVPVSENIEVYQSFAELTVALSEKLTIRRTTNFILDPDK